LALNEVELELQRMEEDEQGVHVTVTVTAAQNHMFPRWENRRSDDFKLDSNRHVQFGTVPSVQKKHTYTSHNIRDPSMFLDHSSLVADMARLLRMDLFKLLDPRALSIDLR
jgi:hypothetical protein